MITKTIILFFIFSFCVSSQIIINEVQPGPKSPEPEWIELYNNSNLSVNLFQWKISNYNSIKTIPTFSLLPKSFCILTKDTALLQSLKNIPKNTKMVQITIPSLHNGPDTISIRNADSLLVDSFIYNYSWTSAGISLERIDYDKPATEKSNIAKCTSSDSSTAGYKNSTIIKDYNLSLNYINDNTATLKNIGKKSIKYLQCEVFYKNYDKEDLNRIRTYSIPEISVGESILFNPYELKDNEITNKPGLYNYIINCKLDNSDTSFTFTINLEFYVSYPTNTLLINEFLTNPTSENGEFVEIFNTSDEKIYLKNHQIVGRDSKGNKDSILINCKDCFIESKNYFSITNDSSFFNKHKNLINSTKVFYKKSSFSLSVSEDHISLIEYNNSLQDSLNYTEDWYNAVLSSTKDISIEKKFKIKESNNIAYWVASKDSMGSTPSRVNSYDLDLIDDVGDNDIVFINPNPFSRHKYQQNDKGLIEISTKEPINSIILSIFTTSGIEIKQLNPTYINSFRVQASWDGRDNKSVLQEIGAYILFTEISYDSGKVESFKKLLVIGE